MLAITMLLLPYNGYAQVPKLGDLSDGNRSVPVHLIDLYDADSGLVRPGDQPMLPFSTRQTCEPCHSYQTIAGGWHFNAIDTTIDSGRRGQPWILVDQRTGTQIPLSYRHWRGAYHPEQLGITAWQFVENFGRHLPGGGPGELTEDDPPELFLRRLISGALEINCLSCHDAEAGHDQSEFANQVRRQNFRWAATATSGFASVRGAARDMPDNFDIYFGVAPDDASSVPPAVEYELTRFNSQGKVLFEVVRKIPNERCYFCHSSVLVADLGKKRWESDEDIHLTAGMTCVDCHRNGLDHNMVRGYEGESRSPSSRKIASLTCKGCHLPESSSATPVAGRLGAPHPKHAGLPPVHLEKLTCTACHSGPWPQSDVGLVKTSQAHALGTHGVNKSPYALPHILSLVFVHQDDGKIAPHRLLWPAFWGKLRDGEIAPLSPREVLTVAGDTLHGVDSLRTGDWLPLSDGQIKKILHNLTRDLGEGGTPVFIAGGELFSLSDKGELRSEKHPAARPYTWALGHEVRPAAQSLGINGCDDCHATDAPFYFAELQIDSPLATRPKATMRMTEFAGLSSLYASIFSASFLFRPLLKVLIVCSAIVLIGVLLWYGLQGLGWIMRAASEEIDEG